MTQNSWQQQAPPKPEDGLVFNEDNVSQFQGNELAKEAMRLIEAEGEHIEAEDVEGQDEDFIRDYGPFNYEWMFDNEEEFKAQITLGQYFTQEELEEIISRKRPYDQLFMVRWRTYADMTWEPLSYLQGLSGG